MIKDFFCSEIKDSSEHDFFILPRLVEEAERLIIRKENYKSGFILFNN